MKTRLLIFLLIFTCWGVNVFSQRTIQAHQVGPSAAQGKPTQERVAELVRGTDASSTGFVSNALKWYDANMNYWAVGVLMTIESSFIPFPSEVVIPPAVYVASNPKSKGGMTLWLIVVVGTLGAMFGAFINYYLSRWLGRPIIYKFVDSKVGHFLMLSGEKMERAETYFNKHGNISTLIGRLIPVIRQLISIPAGLAKMHVGHFALFTFAGAFIWNCILALLGWLAYRAADPTVIAKYSHQLSIILLVLLSLFCAFIIIKIIIKHHKTTKQ